MKTNSRIPLAPAELETLHCALRCAGPRAADAIATRAGVAATTIYRAAAGVPVQRATVRVLLAACAAVLAGETQCAA